MGRRIVSAEVQLGRKPKEIAAELITMPWVSRYAWLGRAIVEYVDYCLAIMEWLKFTDAERTRYAADYVDDLRATVTGILDEIEQMEATRPSPADYDFLMHFYRLSDDPGRLVQAWFHWRERETVNVVAAIGPTLLQLGNSGGHHDNIH